MLITFIIYIYNMYREEKQDQTQLWNTGMSKQKGTEKDHVIKQGNKMFDILPSS